MIHLDTNFLIQSFLAGSSAQSQVQSWLASGETLNLCTVAWAEFLCGPLSAQDEILARQLFPAPEPLLAADAAKAAELFNNTGRRSRSLIDCMIAATALRVGVPLATGNTADFTPFIPFGLVMAITAGKKDDPACRGEPQLPPAQSSSKT
jgi:predicted nucleic acid-binding protein